MKRVRAGGSRDTYFSSRVLQYLTSQGTRSYWGFSNHGGISLNPSNIVEHTLWFRS